MDKNKTEEKKQPFFTRKKKAAAALICPAAALIWALLWLVFPLEYYSLFFASPVGSTALLAAIAAVLTFPANYICSRVTRSDISVPLHLCVNIIGMVACIFLYSIFRYSKTWLPVLGAAVHIAAVTLVFVKAPAVKLPRINAEKTALRSALCGIICTICSDCLYLFIFMALISTLPSTEEW